MPYNFQDIKNDIYSSFRNKEDGYYNCIPFSLERLTSFVPGIIPGEYYLITGNSGAGKSKLTRTLFIHDPSNYIKKHPELDIKLDILYWSLEEDTKKVYSTEISRILKSKHNKSIAYRDLFSIGKNSMLTQEDLKLIESCENEFNEWAKHLQVFDAAKANPTGIMKEIERFAYEIGRYYHSDNTPFTDDEMDEVKRGHGDWIKKMSYYKTDHSRHYVIIIVDNANLVGNEMGLSKQQNIERLSSDYLLRAKNRFHFIPVLVQQQNSQKEDKKYTSSGELVEDKLEPDLSSLGDCTTTQRDATIAMSIYSPEKHEIPIHSGYDMKILAGHYRSIKILKQRDGIAGKKLGVYFDGAADFFKTLPKSTDTEELNKVYNMVKLKRQKEMNK